MCSLFPEQNTEYTAVQNVIVKKKGRINEGCHRLTLIKDDHFEIILCEKTVMNTQQVKCDSHC